MTLVARELLPKLLAEVSPDVRKADLLNGLEPVINGLIDKLGEC